MHTNKNALIEFRNMKVIAWSEKERRYFEDAKRLWGDPLAYEQSWLYLNQALRRGGWVCRNEEGWMAVARDYFGPGRHAAVVPLSPDLGSFLVSAIQTLGSLGIRLCALKHIPANRLDSVLSRDHLRIRLHPAFSESTYLEEISEDRFPQVLVNVERHSWASEGNHCHKWIPSVPRGAEARELRYQIRRFCRLYLERGVTLDRVRVSEAQFEDIHKALENWLESVKKRFAQAGRPRVRQFESCFLEPVQAVIEFTRRHPAEATGCLIKVGEIPSALWIGTRISSICFSVNVLLADTSIVGLSDFTLYLALLEGQGAGASWVNLGGSELESLFRFKRTLGRGRLQNGYHTRQVVDLEC